MVDEHEGQNSASLVSTANLSAEGSAQSVLGEVSPTPETYHFGTSDDDGPDFEAEAERLRPLFEEAHNATIATNKTKLHALVAARGFFTRARQHKAEFYKAARARGIKAGLTETRVVRFLYNVDVIDGRTSVNRWADALAWLAEKTEGLSDSEAVAAANRVGTLTKIAAIQHAARAKKRDDAAAAIPAPSFFEEMILKLNECEPTDERLEPDTVAVFVEATLGGSSHRYGPIRVEALIRAAVTALPRCPNQH